MNAEYAHTWALIPTNTHNIAIGVNGFQFSGTGGDQWLRETSSSPGGPGAIDGSKPTDPDNDGRYEDLNGNGSKDFSDVVTFFENMENSAVTDNVSSFDFNSNGQIDFADLVELFSEV